MSTYRVENRTSYEDEYFESLDEVIEYKELHSKDNLIFIECCKENETEFNL